MNREGETKSSGIEAQKPGTRKQQCYNIVCSYMLHVDTMPMSLHAVNKTQRLWRLVSAE